MLSDVFIDRPRFAIVISIVITLAGLIALTRIPIAQYPNIVPPQISVKAQIFQTFSRVCLAAGQEAVSAEVPVAVHRENLKVRIFQRN